MRFRMTLISIVTCLAAGAGHAQFLMSGTITTATGNATTRSIPAASKVVQQTAGGALTIPAQAFALQGAAFRTFNFSPSIAQLASDFTSSNASAMLAPGAGPGAFSWCPQGNSPCTDPDQFSATGNFHGQLVYSAGGGYGGTFMVLRNTLGSLARASGGGYSHSNPGTNMNPWGGGLPFSQTQATVAVGAKILTTGAVLSATPTSMATNASQANAPFFRGGGIQTIGQTPSGAINQVGTSPATPTRFVTGFPATTGMVFAFDRTPRSDLFTWTGSDNRNANGHGNITLVASGYSNNLQGEAFPHRLTVAMTISPPVPSMNAVGVASLGILILAGGAYALRRRR